MEMLKEEGLDLTDSKGMHLPTLQKRIKVGNLLIFLILVSFSVQNHELLTEKRLV